MVKLFCMSGGLTASQKVKGCPQLFVCGQHIAWSSRHHHTKPGRKGSAETGNRR